MSRETQYHSPLLDLPGAVAAQPPDSGVAAHYGGPLPEQRQMASAVGLVDLSNRSIVAVTGADRLTWLHSLLSQHVEVLQPGESRQALLLDPQGRVEQHLSITDDGVTAWLDSEPDSGAELSGFLDRMRFMMRVTVEDVTQHWALLVLAGPESETLLRALGLETPDDRAVPAFGGWMRRRRWPDDSYDLCVPRTEVMSLASSMLDHGAHPVGVEAFEAVRVAAGEARHGRDTDERTIPHEVGWARTAVHLDKGCYRGQETVARVHAMGRAPRRMVLLHLDGSVENLPSPGTPVRWEGRSVGRVGTAVRHWEQGPLALALVKQSVPADGELSVEVDDEHQMAASIDPDFWDSALPGAGAGRRAQVGLRSGLLRR